jgi:hypothetical protein
MKPGQSSKSMPSKGRSKKPVNHFYRCQKCGEMVDKRQLDEVLFHETEHKPGSDIQYEGFEGVDGSHHFRTRSGERGP